VDIAAVEKYRHQADIRPKTGPMTGYWGKYLLCVGASALTRTQRLAELAGLRISGHETRNNFGISPIAARGVSLSSGDFHLLRSERAGSALISAIRWRDRSRALNTPAAARVARQMMRGDALSWRRWCA
jgi:hypothetical protein